MNNLANTPTKVAFREKIEFAEKKIQQWQEEGICDDANDYCELTHYFSPIIEEFGCAVYGRQLFIPKDTLIIGKIHKHGHLNVILKGKILVTTEFGQECFEAPHVFVSKFGTKRGVRAVEDTLWLTVHLTTQGSEEHLDEIENEVIAPDYQTLGLENTMNNLFLDGEVS